MEALILALGTLLLIVIVETAYAMARSIVRWTPCLMLGALVGVMSAHAGATEAQSLMLAALACIGARHFAVRPI